MWVNSAEDYRPGSYLARLREGDGPWEKELSAQAIGEAFGASHGELLLESTLWPNEAAQETHNSASIFKTTSDVAGALRHAPASLKFSHVTTLAHMPATHNAPYVDACKQAGDRTINPAPGFEYRPPAQPVDVTSSIMLKYIEDVSLSDKWGSQHCESCEEDSGFGDCSGDSTSNGRVSPETSEELPTRRLPAELPTRGSSVERSAGRKWSKRKAKPKVSPADTGGRDADLMPADTPTEFPAQLGLSAESADAPVACLPQADESAMSADTPTDLPSQLGLSTKSADTPIACPPQADESTSADTPEDVPAASEDVPAPLESMLSKPEDVTATADTSDGVADTSDGVADTSDSVADASDNVADFSDGVADVQDDVADSPGGRQASFGLPLSALQAGADEEKQLKDEKKQKLFKVMEEKKKGIQDKEEERWTSMTPPLSRSRSSRTSTKFQGCRQGVETSDPTMHGVTNYFLRMSGLPRFDETFKNYPAFWRKWSSYERHHHQLTPQRELVQLFQENCVSKEIAHRIRRLETMPEVWERLDSRYDVPMQFINELTLEVLAIPKINDGEYEKLLEYYETLKDNIGEAAKNNLQSIFLTSLNIDAMTQVFPPREEELWRQAKRHVHHEDMGLAFAAFVQERFEWFTDQVHELRNTVTASTPSPIDAARSGSVGGKHGTRKNANTVPVQRGNKVKKSARASD
jgi:hypothetical protein